MPESVLNVWPAVLGEIELVLSPANFATWIKPLTVLKYEEGLCVIGAPNAFAKARVENKYQPLFEKTLSKLLQTPIKIVCQISDQEEVSLPGHGLFQPAVPQMDGISKKPDLNQPNPLLGNNYTQNKHFSFDSFVVGSHNKLAQAASLAVAESPGEAYNPLFLYGDVGLGKTHLMHAIAQKISSSRPDSKIAYITSEKFTNELISSIRTNQTENFRQKYRQLDVLLVDDVQFIAGKETTQEEFFHTFNSLYEAGRQIVLSSDRPPQAIHTLEARLQSRFTAGLIADIQKPDYETRVAILTTKAQERGWEIPPEVLAFIAAKVDSNVRELEGSLIRIFSHCRIYRLPITLDIATNLLSMFGEKNPAPALTPDKILKEVCAFYRIEPDQIKGTSRRQEFVVPRQVCMYLLREITNASLNQIGSLFGGKDHTTVLHACQKIEVLIPKNTQIKDEIAKIKGVLGC